jgi:hypothetical protein
LCSQVARDAQIRTSTGNRFWQSWPSEITRRRPGPRVRQPRTMWAIRRGAPVVEIPVVTDTTSAVASTPSPPLDFTVGAPNIAGRKAAVDRRHRQPPRTTDATPGSRGTRCEAVAPYCRGPAVAILGVSVGSSPPPPVDANLKPAGQVPQVQKSQLHPHFCHSVQRLHPQNRRRCEHKART